MTEELEPAAHIAEKSDYDVELVWNTEDSETGMIRDSLYTASDIIKLTEDQPVFHWNCPSGGHIFEDFIRNDRKKDAELRCPKCGKEKEQIVGNALDNHTRLIPMENLIQRLEVED